MNIEITTVINDNYDDPFNLDEVTMICKYIPYNDTFGQLQFTP